MTGRPRPPGPLRPMMRAVRDMVRPRSGAPTAAVAGPARLVERRHRAISGPGRTPAREDPDHRSRPGSHCQPAAHGPHAPSHDGPDDRGAEHGPQPDRSPGRPGCPVALRRRQRADGRGHRPAARSRRAAVGDDPARGHGGVPGGRPARRAASDRPAGRPRRELVAHGAHRPRRPGSHGRARVHLPGPGLRAWLLSVVGEPRARQGDVRIPGSGGGE